MPVNSIYKKIRPIQILALISLALFCSLLHLSFGYEYKLIYVVSAMLLFLFCLSINKTIYIAVILLYCVTGLVYAPVGINYGFPDINAVSSLMYTDPHESFEYIKGLPTKTYLYMIGIAAFSLFSLKMTIKKTAKIRMTLLILFVFTAFWSSTKDYLQGKSEGTFAFLRSGLPEFRFYREVAEVYLQVKDDNQIYAKVIEIPDEWHPSIEDTDYNTYILVIGESVRKDFMHAFGFSHAENTPWMSQQNGLFFDDFISAAGSTTLSLTNALSIRENKTANLNNSLITLANKAGFNTYWLSNQKMRGIYDSPVGVIGKKANNVQFMAINRSDPSGPDEILLPYIEKALSEKSNHKKLIVIHINGSHPQACDRTKDQYDNFIQSKQISCYVKSINNTDAFLADIAKMATTEKLKWTMAYVSDHGLVSIDKETENANLTHADTHKQNFQVPFFITGYNDKQQIRIANRRSGLSLLPILSQWMGIHDDKLDRSCNWLQAEDCLNQGKIISFNNKIKDYDNLPEDNMNLAN